ncbi:MAG: peptide chain release factor N(5)-glutamine methyltransferase [Proteobacteria bacterium]|nr:peptide chain release factor N(5)-glutamine methyltransferase [Pseudomonadota bacterium]
MTIAEAVEFGKRTLASIFDTDPQMRTNDEMERETNSNVYFLLSGLLKISIPHIKFNSKIELTADQIKTYQNWLERRLTFEPVQYITGETEFWSLPILVGEGVLVPRQDSESLIIEIKKHFSNINGKYHFLDMCCGSGCIGIGLLSVFPNSTVMFSDKYSKPIAYTKKNLSKLNLEKRSEVILSDMFDKLNSKEKFDAIVSNPPYIPSEELKSLSMQITLFEPIEALKAGDSGLIFHEIIARQAKKFLKPNAPLFLEIGYNQTEDVVKLFSSARWQEPRVLPDMAGKPRVLFVRNN